MRQTLNMESIGPRLKKIRLEKGLSLEEVQKKTKIHVNILKIIEGDSLTNLSPVYLKGFLKIYCKFFGLDPKDYIPDYKEQQSKVNYLDIPQKAEKSSPFLRDVSIRLGTFSKSKKIRTALIYILIVIFVSIGLFNLGKVISSRRAPHLIRKKQPAPVQNKADNKKTQSPRLVKLATATNTAAASPRKEAASQIRLTIRARENCWVSLKADGKLLFQRILEKGRAETWQAKDKFELSLGNAGAVYLEVNGQIFTNLGRKAQAQNISITKDGLKIGR